MQLSKSIFVIEDELDLLESLSQNLTSRGYLVRKFSNVKDAILESAQQMPDYIITDLNVPTGRNGLGLIREVRKRDKNLPILLMTGEMTEIVGDIRGLGVQLAAKPLDLKVVYSFLENE